MLLDVGMPCIPVLEDNEGAVQVAQNPITKSNPKHIDVRYYFRRELIGRKGISVIHVSCFFQYVDFLTKSIPRELFDFHRDIVMNSW